MDQKKFIDMDRLNENTENYLNNLGYDTSRNFRCLNPNHEDEHPSMSFNPKNHKAHCFTCNVTYDFLDLIALNEMEAPVDSSGRPEYDFKQAINTAKKLGYQIKGKTSTEGVVKPTRTQKRRITHDKAKNAQEGLEMQIIKDYITLGRQILYGQDPKKEKWHKEAIEYLNRRGISLDTAKTMGLGYLPNWRSAKLLAEYKQQGKDTSKIPATPRLIVPNDNMTGYLARDTRPNLRGKNQIRYAKMRDGVATLYRGAEADNLPVFIVEGEFDALSVYQAGGRAIGLGSVSHIKLLKSEIEYARKLKKGNYHPTYLLALDNDVIGEQAQRKLEKMLREEHVTYYRANIAKGYKDANEALVKDKAGFTKRVQEYTKHPHSRVRDFLTAFSQGGLPTYPTGFENLDNALDGGLTEGLYGLGAISSLGKTTLALQIADQMAMNGQKVLYFALEMGTQELTAKTLSRIIAQRSWEEDGNFSNAQTTRSIMRGMWKRRYSERGYQLFLAAVKKLESYEDNLLIRDGQLERPTALDISMMVGDYIEQTGQKPVVFVDYLQILKPLNDRATDKANVTNSMSVLKQIATRYHIPVFVISSFNRGSYNTAVSMESFKESGDIEYSADALIGLQFKGVEDSEFDVNEAKSEKIRSIEAVILKNRNGRTGSVLEFYYEPEVNLFIDGGTKESQINKPDIPTIDWENKTKKDTGLGDFFYSQPDTQAIMNQATREEVEIKDRELLTGTQGEGVATMKGDDLAVAGASGTWYTSVEACLAAGDKPVEMPF